MSYEIGEVRLVECFFKNNYEVYTGKANNVLKFVRFFNFENAHIFSQLVKLNDRFRDK